MSWPGFHAPSAAWFFLLIPPLVLLYFLKLKRPVVDVPSLTLWAQVLRDQRVNSPFQRFKRNILLWLQLIILCLLVLAAMLPYLRGEDSSNRVLLLLDNSASMAALDKAGGTSRLAAAKQRLRDVIDGLSPSQEAAIITFGHTARQVVPFTNSRRVLVDALQSIEIDEVRSDVLDALRMADGMARSAPFDRVLLFSDGNMPAVLDFDLPFELEFEKLPPAGPNLGITGLRARRDDAGGWSVFVQVQQSAGAEIPCSLDVYEGAPPNQTRIDSQPVHLGSGGQRFVFPIDGSGEKQLEFRLVPIGFDSLAVDNSAWLTLDEMRPLRVYVADPSGFFQHALAALTDLKVDTAPVQGTVYDLVIARDPNGVPAASTALFAGAVPADLSGVVTVETMQVGTDTLVDWQRNSELLEHVEMSELHFGQRVAWAPGAQESQLDSRRYEVLAYGQKGPLIVQKLDGGQLRYHMLFDPARSTLPYRVGFPILCRNLVTVAMQRANLLEVEGTATGVLPARSVRAETEYAVRGPGGSRTEQSDARGELAGIPAPRAGLYRVEGPDLDQLVGASLLSSSETALAAVEDLQLNELSVAAVEERIATDQSLWFLLAGIALLVLLVEWWFFQARPGGYVVRRA